MKQLLRALALTLTLSAAVPAPVFAAPAAPAPRNANNSEYRTFGYAVMAIMAIGGLWWKFWGKKMIKSSIEQTQCPSCLQEFDAKDLISLHSHTKNFVIAASPKINMSHRPGYGKRDEKVNRDRLAKIPKQKHKLCPSCTITTFVSAYRLAIELSEFARSGDMGPNDSGTCIFHTGANMAHGACQNCEGRGLCLYCPVAFDEGISAPERCKLMLDIGWVNRNNPHMIDTIHRLCKDGTYDNDADQLANLWLTLCEDYPHMIAELKAVRPGDYTTRQAIGNKWHAKWNQA